MTYDAFILGASFSGSLLAWILASRGMRVLLVDRGRHPRFAIGESSTPTADACLTRLATRWNLPALAPLARYGSWIAAYPEIGRGTKRGFSYFRHLPGQPFADGPEHDASLLVAASASDEQSDTHWLRADVDAFLHRQARVAGVDCREEIAIVGCDGPGRAASPEWTLRWRQGSPLDPAGSRSSVSSATAPWLIDATGSGGPLAEHLGLDRLDDTLATRTTAVFGHFAGVGSWDAAQLAAGNDSTLEPFRSDDAAQHHLLADGWVWMLRFDDDRCSVGIVSRGAGHDARATSAAERFDLLLADYPSVRGLLADSRPLTPLVATPRLSRLWSRGSGRGWAMLPTTAGFIDPLHSTGIAHALSGVERLAELLLAPQHDAAAWDAYGARVVDEVRWIDCLVSTCYDTLA
ncbi:MAG: NAD(P)/FAD-dependent oxidoreductase, partial [Planctomycetia bacterium]